VVIEPEHIYRQTECWGGWFSNDGGLIGDKMRGQGWCVLFYVE
jgi:hypothetical protein